MGFSKPQQGHYRRAVSAAFAATGLDKSEYRAWYESELLTCVGVTSTVPLDKGRDFDVAIAHFEQIEGSSTYWQQKAETGDYRRILHSVFGSDPPIIAGQQVTPDYLRGIAKQALRLDHAPPLRTLSKPHLRIVIRSLAIHASRHQ